MKQRPKPCQQLLQLRVWTSPAWRFCCIFSAWVGGGGVGTPSRNPIGFLSWGCRQRIRKPRLSLFSPNWRPDMVSKWEIKLACWVAYSQTICPGHKGRPPQGPARGEQMFTGTGFILVFLERGLQSTPSICMNPCILSLHPQRDPVALPTQSGHIRHLETALVRPQRVTNPHPLQGGEWSLDL